MISVISPKLLFMLSNDSWKSLPQSFCKLVAIQKLFAEYLLMSLLDFRGKRTFAFVLGL